MQTVHPRASIAAALIPALFVLSPSSANAADFGIFGEVGSMGLGGGLAVQFDKRFSARASYSRVATDINDYEAEDLEFDADVTLAAAKLLFDWYPTPSSFRITAGAMLNQMKATAVADPQGGGYTINGTFYPSFAIGSATGRADFDRFAPYLGVGFGRALGIERRFNVTVDVGAAFVGDPNVALNVTCTSVVPTAVCNRIQQDVAAEQAEAQNDADDLKFLPYANVAFSYRF